MAFINLPDPSTKDGMRLELITCPLYDTTTLDCGASAPMPRRKLVMDEGYTHQFFQNPAGRSSAYTNVHSAGSLCWPKRFWIQGIQLDFNFPLVFSETEQLFARIKIGEKFYFSLPLRNFEHREDNIDNERARYRQSIDNVDVSEYPEMTQEFLNGMKEDHRVPGICILPLQDFSAILEGVPKHMGGTECRCTLLGVLAREIQ